MKLTKFDREAFVNAVMNDVPKVDYDAQAQKLATAWLVAQLPEPVRKVYEAEGGRYRDYLEKSYIAMPGCLQNFYAPATSSVSFYDDDELKALNDKAIEQNRSRSALRENLEAVIASCSTLKQAKERLPEFEKYLPTERGASGLSNLPAIANVVAELTKAGWPKGQEPAAA